MPDGLEAISVNAAANGVAVTTRWLNLGATAAPWAPTVTANLTLDLLEEIASGALERPPERLVASGFLTAQADAAAAAFAQPRAGGVRPPRPGRVGGAAHGTNVIRMAVRVARRDAEAVLAELLELAPGGLEEREIGDDQVEYVVYGAPGELPALPAVRAAAGAALVDVSTSEIPDDWSERWKAFHHPVDVSWRFRRLRVRPPGRRRSRATASTS